MIRKGGVGGYTIVEIVIALSVLVVLLSVSIPRYNSMVRQQDFNLGTQKIAGCLQEAQKMTLVPRNYTLRFSGAKMTVDTVNGSITCNTYSYAEGTSVASLLNETAVPLTTQVSTVQQNITITNVSVSSGSNCNNVGTVWVFFGAVEKGIPVAYASYDQGGGLCQKADPADSLKPYGLGNGFALTINFRDASASLGLSRSVSIHRLGVPIQIDNM